MNLVWKLLRQHISIPQFVGFAFANLFGMLIVLLGYQFYKDVSPVFTSEDSFMKSNYIIVEKKIGTGKTLSGRSNAFSKDDIDDLNNAHFTFKTGAFTSNQYGHGSHGHQRNKHPQLRDLPGEHPRCLRRCTERNVGLQARRPRGTYHSAAATSLCTTSGLHRTARCRRSVMVSWV